MELLKAGANTSARNDDQVSPLALAVQHGHQDIAVLLLDAGVRISRTRARELLCVLVLRIMLCLSLGSRVQRAMWCVSGVAEMKMIVFHDQVGAAGGGGVQS